MPASRVKYQMLPVDDRTPALEVHMSEIDLNQQQTDVNYDDQPPQFAQLPSTSSSAVTAAAAQYEHLNISTAPNTAQPQLNSFSDNKFITHPEELYPSINELPTYSEAIYQKHLESTGQQLYQQEQQHQPIITNNNPHIVNYDSRDPVATTDLQVLRDEDIGTDCSFLFAFMISFFFNWIGFFTSICLIPTMAGKYGALSGFGLSMAKWVAILRYQEWLVNVNDFQQKIFFWVFFLVGIYLFFRGLLTYVQLKYNHSLQQTRRINIQWFGFR